jgi:hypothetical protein
MIERHDEYDPHMPLWMSCSNWISFSLDMHFFIMPLAPHRNKIPSVGWYCLDVHVIRSTLVLSSDGDWFSRNILIGFNQSYSGSWSGSLITIRSCLIASLAASAGLTEGLDSFSIMISGRVGALEEAIHARWSASRFSRRGTYHTSNPLKNFSILHTSTRYSPIFSLLQSYSFWTWFNTSCESPMIRSHQMPRFLASQRPVTSLYYSTMLFVAENSSWIAYLKMSHSGGMSMTPAPAPLRV